MGVADDRKTALPVARHIAPRWDAARTEGNLTRTRARVRSRVLLTRAIGATAVMGLVLAAVVLVRGRWSAESAVAQRPVAVDEQRTVHFNDGSSVELLDATSKLDVGAVSDERVEVTLTSGTGQFEVAPRPGRRFVVHAGAVEVVVVGTSFRVTRADPRVHVSVDRGRVEVVSAAAVRVLSAGESSWFDPAEAPAPDERPIRPTTTNPPGPAASAPATPTELMQAADAARLSNHPAQAVTFLERVTREFPKDSRAPLAAFTMGRILMSQLEHPDRAADAFGLARRLSPNGPLAPDALAREAEAAELAGGHDRARVLSEEYARRYPQGRRLHGAQPGGAN
jgi:transmembrane sensor